MSEKQGSLFGTDGVRGRFGDFPFTEDGLRRLGRAVASCIGDVSVLAAMDTRFSGPEILGRLREGMGRSLRLNCAGVLPTPGLSYLMVHGAWQYGIMITASHNPAEDNGIKLFNSQGEKIPDELEERISQMFWQESAQEPVASGPGTAETDAGSAPYIDFLVKQARMLDLRGITLLVDTANGAMSAVAPAVLKETGARIIVRANSPDGRNINRECGSQYPERLLAAARAEGAQWGIAFDGDGDRVLVVDGQGGEIFDGDDILYLLARYRHSRDASFRRIVVGTVMSNLGLETSLRSIGIELVRTHVGDRHVYQEMKRIDAELGGEPSGHVIIRSMQRSGDGLLTALHFFRALCGLELTAAEIHRHMRRFPQRLQNIRVTRKPELKQWPELLALEEEFQRETGDKQARLLVRYSGTEPKIRLMVEAENDHIVDAWIDRLHSFIMNTIGE